MTSKNSLAPAYDTANSVHESVHMKWIKSHQALINLGLGNNEYDTVQGLVAIRSPTASHARSLPSSR